MSVFQLVLQDPTLKVVMDYLIKGIQRCQTWARPDIMKALAAVVYENCDKIQQVCIFYALGGYSDIFIYISYYIFIYTLARVIFWGA